MLQCLHHFPSSSFLLHPSYLYKSYYHYLHMLQYKCPFHISLNPHSLSPSHYENQHHHTKCCNIYITYPPFCHLRHYHLVTNIIFNTHHHPTTTITTLPAIILSQSYWCKEITVILKVDKSRYGIIGSLW